jgi:adenosylhomocysteine/aminodeoxyfutalosine nucleosidase
MMIIGIIGAMQEEIEPLLEFVNEYETINYANNNFYKAKFNEHTLVIVYSKIGKVNSTLTATTLIEKFGVQKVIFSGVAGAIDENLKIGDLIVATKLVQHDVDITAFGHPFGFIPESGDFVLADEELNSIALEVAKKMNIKLFSGIVATGDQFIANDKKKNWIKETYNADALEMEGASVAYVCKSFDVPFCVLRAISDAADMDAGFNFDEFLKSSAVNSAKFVYKMLEYIK